MDDNSSRRYMRREPNDLNWMVLAYDRMLRMAFVLEMGKQEING